MKLFVPMERYLHGLFQTFLTENAISQHRFLFRMKIEPIPMESDKSVMASIWKMVEKSRAVFLSVACAS